MSTEETISYDKPHAVSDILMAFPGLLGDLLPPAHSIPDGYDGESFWNQWQADWFFNGLEEFPKAKPGIDENEAHRHLAAIQRSFQPKHEHKQAAVAWLASLWLERPARAAIAKATAT